MLFRSLLAALGETKDGAPSRRLRAMSAIVGLCTRVGRESGADYAAHRFDALAYGGEVYGWLRAKGAKPADIATAAMVILGPLSESLSHPRAWGSFPRILGRYVREEKLLTLEEAVRKMTSRAAARVHLEDRGILRPGMTADITDRKSTRLNSSHRT